MSEKEDNIQKLYVEFQELDQQIKQLEQQNNQLSAQLTDLTSTVQNLDDIKSIKNGTEILVPISGGIYAKAELKDNKNFIVNVGSNVTTVKDVDSTKKLIETQISEIKKLQIRLIEELQNNTTKAKLIEQEINSIASTLQNN